MEMPGSVQLPDLSPKASHPLLSSLESPDLMDLHSMQDLRGSNRRDNIYDIHPHEILHEKPHDLHGHQLSPDAAVRLSAEIPAEFGADLMDMDLNEEFLPAGYPTFKESNTKSDPVSPYRDGYGAGGRSGGTLSAERAEVSSAVGDS